MGVNVARDGKVWVRGSACENCLLGSDRLVDGERARQLIRDTRAAEGGSFVCHRSQVSDEPEAICSEWWERFAMEDVTMRLAVVLGLVERT